MAHSNREKLKKQRGGLTRNQAMKAGRSNQQQERLRAVTAWADQLEKRKHEVKDTPKSLIAPKKVSMKASTKIRRKKALARLEIQFETVAFNPTPQNISRIQGEISTLKKRI